jgi:chromosome transmission fidelity protein 4
MDLEEASVRANIALTQKKVLNEIDDDEYGQSEEYIALCTDVDKVTLKLLYNKICDGRLDAALGLIQRLHLEDTFDVAIKMADRHRQNKLASLIEEEKLRRFSAEEGEDGDYDDYEGASSILMDRFDHASRGSSQISPESSQFQQKKRSMVLQEREMETVTKKHRTD